ncbi:hypothetical protein KbCgl_03100 [Corynebacterium glutamicum]|nr:hypothetical protein KbCgl_03100 [Corynebacterium glutamicum]
MVRKIRAKLVLQLRAEGLSGSAISSSQAISRKSVATVIDAAEAAGADWDEVYELLFPGRGEHHSVFAEPNWSEVHKELARVGVTLKLLHSEYTDRSSVGRSPITCVHP